MGNVCRSPIATALAATLALTAFNLSPAQAGAPAKQSQVQSSGTFDLSARKRHVYRHAYRHRGNDRAAFQMFGMVAGTIASIAAAEEARRDYRNDYGYYDYGYPPPYYGYRRYHRY